MKKEIVKRIDLSTLILNAVETLNTKEYKEFCNSFNDKYDYSSITDMNCLFENCELLEYIPPLLTKM